MLRCLICTEWCWLHKAAPPFVGADNAGPFETPTWAEWAYLAHPLNMGDVLIAAWCETDVKSGRWSLSLTSPLICRVIDGPGGNVAERSTLVWGCLLALLLSRRCLSFAPRMLPEFQRVQVHFALCSCLVMWTSPQRVKLYSWKLASFELKD